MMTDGAEILDRMVLAVELVRRRLERAAAALEYAGILYAVIGGNAIFLWMTRHGEGGARNTPNVDLLLNRADLPYAKSALEAAGFVGDSGLDDLFRDGPDGSPRTRLRLLFAEERVRDTERVPNPAAAASVRIEAFQVLCLPELVQTKLTAYRTIDRVHLLDLLDVGLIDRTWTTRYPPELAERLQLLIDTPNG